MYYSLTWNQYSIELIPLFDAGVIIIHPTFVLTTCGQNFTKSWLEVQLEMFELLIIVYYVTYVVLQRKLL